MKNKYIINSLIAAAMLSVVGCKNDYDPMDTLCDGTQVKLLSKAEFTK